MIKENDLYKELIEEYGDLQIVVAVEEMAELQQELTKALRGKPDIKHIVEEMADVYIMLDQMKIMFNIPNQLVRLEKQQKILRTIRRREEKQL